MRCHNIVVTGGAGYIGSHTVVELLQAGFEVAIIDNLENSDARVVDRIESITGRRPQLVVADIRDRDTVAGILKDFRAEAVIHFAGLKLVNESCAQPLRYYDVNVAGTIRLLEAMTEAQVTRMVFSSSTTVYGETATVPIAEESPLKPISPYGRSKLMVEDMLRDLVNGPATDWRLAILRYFNPVGAHESGLIGEDANGSPSNLMPYVTGVAIGRLPKLAIFGNDYPTRDGTAIRDFIHVVDLARGHLAALRALAERDDKVLTVNLGTGHGATVLELVKTFEEVTGATVPYEFAGRRQGDVVVSFADASRARSLLGWKTERNLAAMCRDAWNWQSQNPRGYRSK